MPSLSRTTHMLLLLLAFLGGGLCSDPTSDVERTLTARLNPGCPEGLCARNNVNVTLIHIRADSAVDTIHYVWDFTGKPSILVALTGKNATLDIQWDDFFALQPRSIRFSEPPQYTFMTIINRIFQFDDPDDKGTMEENAAVFAYDPHTFHYNRTLMWFNEKDVIAMLRVNDNYLFKMNAYSGRAYGMDYPHLFHTSNSTQIDIVFNNISAKFDRPRIALELVFVVSEQAASGKGFEIITRKNLNDEHTPGVFEIVDVVSPGAATSSTGGGYLEYRPVSYTHPERDVSTSTETHQSEPKPVQSPSNALNSTLAYAFHGSQLDSLLVQSMNISFGFGGDGFYSKTNYTTMTFQVGYGVPPIEKLSPFVVMLVGIGLGLPLVMLFFGGIYVCGNKLRNRLRTRA